MSQVVSCELSVRCEAEHAAHLAVGIPDALYSAKSHQPPRM